MTSDDIVISARETAYHGFFKIDRFRLRHRLFRGGWTEELSREAFLRPNAAAVLPYDPERDQIVLIEQFRLPAYLAGFPAWQTEIVAGLLDTDESAAAVGERETREEAGLTIIGELVPIHRYMPSPGGSTEIIDLFCGRVDAGNAGGIHGLAEESEDIRVVTKSAAEALALLQEGVIQNGVTLLALYWFAAHRDELRRNWLGSS